MMMMNESDHHLDAIDRNLIDLLRRHARRTNVSLAREIGISDVAVYKRIRRLLDLGIIECTINADYHRIGVTHSVVLCINVEPACREALVRTFLEFPTTIRVTRTSGKYNAICSVGFTGPDNAAAFLTDFIPRVKGIRHLEHLTVVQTSSNLKNGAPVGVLDEKDVGIVRSMIADSRQSTLEIAQHTGIAHSTIRRRLAYLINTGIVAPILIIKPGTPGYAEGNVLLKVEPAKLSQVWNNILRLPAVMNYVSLLTGAYDIITSVWGDSRRTLQTLIRDDFCRLPGVTECRFLPNEGTTCGYWLTRPVVPSRARSRALDRKLNLVRRQVLDLASAR